MGEQRPGPQEAETCEWDDHVTLCPGLHGAVPAYDCYLLVIINSDPFALRNDPVWVINDGVYLWREVWPEALRPGVWTRIRMLGL